MEEIKEQDGPESASKAEPQSETDSPAAPPAPAEADTTPAADTAPAPGGDAGAASEERSPAADTQVAPKAEPASAQTATGTAAPAAEPASEPSVESAGEPAPAPAGEPASAPAAKPAAEAATGDGEAGDESEAPEAEAGPKPVPEDPNKRWYIVHTYSGYEQKVKLSLERQLQTYRKSKVARDKRIASYIGEILIPTENVVELVKGQRKTTTRKFFPGYILVQMEDNEESRHFVRETPKVSGFVGGGREPTPISKEELGRILRQQTEGAERPKPKVQFEHGENIRVINGPFANFTGVVEDVKPEKGKVKVLVTIFGRATPVELSFVEVEKT